VNRTIIEFNQHIDFTESGSDYVSEVVGRAISYPEPIPMSKQMEKLVLGGVSCDVLNSIEKELINYAG
jgi:hypothetical protein